MFFRLKRSKEYVLFSNIIRERDGWTCQRCKLPCEDNKAYLDCSHVYGRGCKSVRWDLENAFAMCKKCHDFFTKNPEENKEFARIRLGERKFDLLTFRAKNPQKIDLALIYAGLKGLWSDMEAKKPMIFGKRR